MSAISASERMPRPVSSKDLPSLDQLRQQYEDMHSNEVRAIRGESVAGRLETIKRLYEHVLQRLGGLAAEQQIMIGVATVDASEDVLLEEARRLQPPEQRYY